MKLTEKLHIALKLKGYYYIKENNLFVAYCKSIRLSEHKTEEECLASFRHCQ